MDRRTVLAGGLGLGLTACTPLPRLSQAQARFAPRLQALEKSSGGRLGAFIHDTGSGETLSWRADERFCHCSTFKFSLAAYALQESDAGRLNLDERLAISPSDIMFHSPEVKAHIDEQPLPIRMLAEAAQVTSDNAAANVLMKRLGGPAAMTRFWREIGDNISRIDGYEPQVNVIPPGTEENSTSPAAMGETLRKIVLGDILSAESRALLISWMEATRTGKRRIRAGIPGGWRALDKTGTGFRPSAGNKTNDISVLYPPGGRAPLIVTGYLETSYFEGIRAEDEAVLKGLGEIAADWAMG